VSDYYPTEEELKLIKTWKYDDFHGLMQFIYTIWNYADWGWHHKDDQYSISTGGWSGNEDIINAMQENIIWWQIFWYSTTRGGHYIFKSER